MLDWILIGIALALGGGSGGEKAEPGADASAAKAASPAFAAEDQTPTGKFTTAAEIKQIIELTKPNWVAVRDYNGQDLLYVTHLLSWRCGMHEFRLSVNGEEMEPWDMPPCYLDTATPNAIKPEVQVYRTFPPGHVQRIEIEILFDDLSTARAAFSRDDILLP
ncbi:hypothetical protein [Roseovarius aestuariivivens]|uniref:hypothetical protein n=1 Tax=Roseovarius aestuariivivens TaxID=1888910 RepID=UPI0010802674|nr:hypothetical protein [Roseovarius aestuariivivens]